MISWPLGGSVCCPGWGGIYCKRDYIMCFITLNIPYFFYLFIFVSRKYLALFLFFNLSSAMPNFLIGKIFPIFSCLHWVAFWLKKLSLIHFPFQTFITHLCNPQAMPSFQLRHYCIISTTNGRHPPAKQVFEFSSFRHGWLPSGLSDIP